MRESCGGVQAQKEQVLDDDGSARKEGRGKRWVLLDTRPGQVNIEQKQQNAETNDGSLEAISLASGSQWSWSVYPHRIGCRHDRAG